MGRLKRDSGTNQLPSVVFHVVLFRPVLYWSLCCSCCRLRRSVQSLSAVDSMSHAVIRGYIEQDQAERLIPILHNKVHISLHNTL